MLRHRSFVVVVAAAVLSVLFPGSSAAQLRGQLYVSGLTHPLAFVQDPADPGVQFVVEQGGVIRVVQGGTLLPAPFLDLSASISTGGERGLLSLAFQPSAPNRFFVTFADTVANTVVARFNRSGDPLVADPGSRFDLQWSTGLRYLPHPEIYHYGGGLQFGPDGYLYIGTGDGGQVDDASNEAQNPSSLFGKFLRINVNVPDSDNEGFDIPPGNPFAGGGGAPEVWSIGFRNPWRFSIDDPARGGTGAFVIADVGENAFEELDYEPANRPGRNYGWRYREGLHDHNTALPPFGAITDPIFEYDHSVGRSITGGYVYRGNGIPSLRGRYVFGDFIRGRVWSLALSLDGNGEATALDLREHTSEVGAATPVRSISSFGVDANGELYIVNYSDGTVVAIKESLPTSPPPSAIVQIDAPAQGSQVRQPFGLSGWAIDPTAPTPGIATLHVWAFPATGAPPQFLGVATHGASRPDVAAFFGPQFDPSGFGITVKGLTPGGWTIAVYAWVISTQSFSAVNAVTVTIVPSGLIAIDAPANLSTVPSPFFIGGWAIDLAAASGTGIDTIHVWAHPADGSAPVFLGVAGFGDRPDVAAIFGAQFRRSGYGLIATALPPGGAYIVVYAHSSVSGQFDTVAVVYVLRE
jgi:glucose/arabinose dehydrogenase